MRRVARLASAMLVVLAFRSCFRDGSCVASMHQQTSRSGLSPTISFLRTLLLLSMTLHTIIYTSYLRFQFKTQLLFQTAHLVLLVFCNSAGAHPGCCVCCPDCLNRPPWGSVLDCCVFMPWSPSPSFASASARAHCRSDRAYPSGPLIRPPA
jgi:hypothetical protein